MNSQSDREVDRPLPRGICRRCGATWVGRRSGRPRIWCSHRCRRAACEERRAAANGAIAIRDASPSRNIDHDLSECVSRVVASPSACRRVLHALRDRDLVTQLATEPRWEPVREEIGHLLTRLTIELAPALASSLALGTDPSRRKLRWLVNSEVAWSGGAGEPSLRSRFGCSTAYRYHGARFHVVETSCAPMEMATWIICSVSS